MPISQGAQLAQWSATRTLLVRGHQSSRCWTLIPCQENQSHLHYCLAAFCSFGFETGWTKTETIDSLMRKAGYNGAITEPLRKRIQVTRYQSTLYTMHYSDYASYVKRTRGAFPAVIGSRPNH